jgi:hypothetical protein
MLHRDLFIIWPGSPLLSVLLWIGVAVALLYLARFPAHRAIISFTRMIHGALRLASRSTFLLERRVVARTREVMINAGVEERERSLEREFQRIAAAVTCDLSGYPALQRTLVEQSGKIDEEYRNSALVPPPPPGWVRAVEVLAKLPAEGDASVAPILTSIHKTIESQYHTAMTDYNRAVGERQAILKRIMPYWRKVSATLDEMEGRIKRLEERAKLVDISKAEYEEIRSQSDQAVRALTASSISRFFTAVVFLFIALGGVVLNFHLIALPMSEMVGGGSYIGSFRSSSVAALVIIFVEFAMGLYLMEFLGITRLFPSLGQLDDKMRHRLAMFALLILTILAGVEASLAYVRDQLAGELQLFQQSLAQTQEAQPVSTWIPVTGQMVIAFILPFALTFGAIPLESLIKTGRIVLGITAAAALGWAAFALRVMGHLFLRFGRLVIQLYDLLIFPPLWVEGLLRYRCRRDEGFLEEQAPQ